MSIINDIKICALGGDMRQIYALQKMKENNAKISVFGLESNESDFYYANDLSDALKNAQYILLPLPFSTDGIRVFCPLGNTDIKLDDVLDKMNESQVLIGGKMSNEFVKKAKEKNIETFDYFASEKMTVKNARITAEGAVCVAMNELKQTLYNSKCAIIGYGRIGKFLAQILKNINSSVTVFARREETVSLAECFSVDAKNIKELKKYIDGYDVVFNTVPSKVITKEHIDKTKKNVLFIDLASAPSGIDGEYAKKQNRKVVYALSLPGKYAPKTAGEIIEETVASYIRGDLL